MSGEEQRIKLGTKIREARMYRGFSQEQVAKFLGISRSSVSLIESGNRGIDSFELQRLAGLFECSIEELLIEDNKRKSTLNSVEIIARATSGLSDEDIKEVIRFAEFLETRKRKINEQSQKSNS